MIGPFETFDQLGVDARFFVHDLRLPDGPTMAKEVAAGFARHNLTRGREELRGHYFVFQHRDRHMVRLERSKLYTLALPDEVLAGVRAHIAAIAKHGPGHVWFLCDPVHVVKDDQLIVGQTVAGNPDVLVLLRTFYGHEAQAVPA